jgi:hypothetical protein
MREPITTRLTADQIVERADAPEDDVEEWWCFDCEEYLCRHGLCRTCEGCEECNPENFEDEWEELP